MKSSREAIWNDMVKILQLNLLRLTNIYREAEVEKSTLALRRRNEEIYGEWKENGVLEIIAQTIK